jgi:hypothetical protein
MVFLANPLKAPHDVSSAGTFDHDRQAVVLDLSRYLHLVGED